MRKHLTDSSEPGSEPEACPRHAHRAEEKSPVSAELVAQAPDLLSYAPHNTQLNDSGGRPPGRLRIATGGEGNGWCGGASGGGRPPGRLRIATSKRRATATPSPAWRSPSGATEDRNDSLSLGGRLALECGGRPPGRLRIATCPACWRSQVRSWWRSPSGATEDRNSVPCQPPYADLRRWRSPSGATEDRNAGAFGRDVGEGFPGGGRPPGRLRIATGCPSGSPCRRTCGGRPPGRLRIATAACTSWSAA